MSTVTSARSATTVRTVAIEDIDATDTDRWAKLADRALEPHPFLHPDFVLPARRSFPPREAGRPFPSVRGLRLTVVEQDDRWLALLPVARRSRFHGTPLPYVTTAGPFLGTRAPVCAPLIADDDATTAVDALLDHLSSARSGLPGLLELTLLPDGALLEILRERTAARHLPMRVRWQFERACWTPSDSPWRRRVSRSRRSKLKRWAATITRESDAGLLVRDAGGDPAALDRVLDLEAAGWKGDRAHHGGALRAVPGASEWITDVARGFRDRGQLHVYLVEAGDRLVYGAVCLGARSSVFGVLDAYDGALASSSPGSVGRAAVLDHVEELGRTAMFDPCMHPRYEVASGVFPDRRTVVGLLIGARGPGRLAVRWHDSLVRLRRRVRTARRAVRAWSPAGRSSAG